MQQQSLRERTRVLLLYVLLCCCAWWVVGWVGGLGAVRAASAVVLLYTPTANSTCGKRRKDPFPVRDMAGDRKNMEIQ